MSRRLRYKIGLWATIILIIAVYPGRACLAHQALQVRLEDGVVLKVHLPEEPAKGAQEYARQVLQAAGAAYREIVFNQGFCRLGYTFVQPTRSFAYDSDGIIDIYIVQVESPFAFIQPQSGLEYKAEIFLPADYKGYQKRNNIKDPQSELKASLAHELFHVISFSYNRNMQTIYQGKVSLTSQRWDWYNEGLARYFETLVGYREEFLSSGFRRESGGNIEVYKGGVNYFLRYPDKPLNERKYDFALFWQYLHQHYGMDKIEQISFKFRQIDPLLCSSYEAMGIIARTLGITVAQLWQDFSLYVYKSSCLPTEGEKGLQPVSASKLPFREEMTRSICSFGLDFYEVDLKQNSESVQINGPENLRYLAAVSAAENFRILPLKQKASGEMKIDTSGLHQDSKLIIMLSNPTGRMSSYSIFLD